MTSDDFDASRRVAFEARARAMRAKALKGLLARAGARYDDCLEKEELVQRIADIWLASSTYNTLVCYHATVDVLRAPTFE